MPSPAICMLNAEIPNGILQIKDLAPNRSQASAVYDPAPQGPRYIRQPVDALPKATNGEITLEVNGLASYLLANTDRGNGDALTPAESFVASTAIIALMRGGASLALAVLNKAVDDASGNGGAEVVDAGNNLVCSGRVDDVLAILAGADYILPVGYMFAKPVGTFLPASNASIFNEGQYLRVDEDDSSFWISVEQGDLLGAKNYRIDPNTGLTLHPLVVVYDGNGNVL